MSPTASPSPGELSIGSKGEEEAEAVVSRAEPGPSSSSRPRACPGPGAPGALPADAAEASPPSVAAAPGGNVSSALTSA